MSARPNIVLIVNDHQAYYRHGWDGGPRPQTPNFDRLAAAGIHFERSYCAVPLCGPSRRTLLTGLYPHNHRNIFNYSNSPYDHEVYLDNLADAGYRNFYFGKWHAGAGTALDFYCEGYSLEDYGNPYITPEYHDYLKKRGLPPAEHRIEYVFNSFVMKREFPDLQGWGDLSQRSLLVRRTCDGHHDHAERIARSLLPGGYGLRAAGRAGGRGR